MDHRDQISTVGCIIMASGMGKRFGSNKLLAPFRGKPLLQHILDTTAQVPFAYRLVVTRHPEVVTLCDTLSVPVVLHEYSDRSQVVQVGLQTLLSQAPKSLCGCMFCPGDQPLVRADSMRRMIACFGAENSASSPEFPAPTIYRLSAKDVPASPILFAASHFPELIRLPQGKGGSHLAKRYPDQVCLIPAASLEELADVDTPEDLLLLEERASLIP